jgi:hypothetical protein
MFFGLDLEGRQEPFKKFFVLTAHAVFRLPFAVFRYQSFLATDNCL